MKNKNHLGLRANFLVNLLKVSHFIKSYCGAENSIAPPDYMQVQYGCGPYFEIGLHFFRLLLDHCQLQRNSAILDVGSGIGRNSLPLTAFLDSGGRYDGFDIMPDGVEYCANKITKHYPAFNFQTADVFNSLYNPRGNQQADNFRFPFDDSSFDIVFSTSVFTHLPPSSVSQYLKETYRVLKAGGKCLHTCFALDGEAIENMKLGKTNPILPYQYDGFVTSNPKRVEAAIGIPDNAFRDMYVAAGFDEVNFFPGTWAARTGPCTSYQDFYTATKL